MSCSTHLTQELRQRGFRMTPQRQVILHILHDAKQHLSPVDIFNKANRDVPGLTEATVYRTLEFLAQNEMVHSALNSNGHLVYELAGHEHHHLVCQNCDESIEIDHAVLQKLYGQLEADSGYILNTSHMTFFGLCSICQNKPK